MNGSRREYKVFSIPFVYRVCSSMSRGIIVKSYNEGIIYSSISKDDSLYEIRCLVRRSYGFSYIA